MTAILKNLASIKSEEEDKKKVIRSFIIITRVSLNEWMEIIENRGKEV